MGVFDLDHSMFEKAFSSFDVDSLLFLSLASSAHSSQLMKFVRHKNKQTALRP